ncbi:hypothetical protein JKP88DRAFT_333684 [Tribonema minus]|uniref:RING-type E3 ubiquitin transferase n=1 Tax=Tribonema minus TaxID=303371 RepID=A0A836C9D8_9STRA|nr:hypothetical protein JKP88DRAFT_333684 [Tribonema minus]
MGQQQQQQQQQQEQQGQTQQKPRSKPRRHRRKGRAAAAVLGGGDDDELLCAVCTGPMDFYAVGECDHPVVCATCTLRSRVLLKNRSCPICKADQEKVLVAALEEGNAPRPYASFPVWGDTAGPGSELDADSGMLFIDCAAHYAELARLKSLQCTVAACPERGAVAGHHQRHYCALCLEHRPLFPPEQELFSAAALRKHEQGVGGHPLCRFCGARHFDAAALYRHMNGAHISCHLCAPEHAHRYYRQARSTGRRPPLLSAWDELAARAGVDAAQLRDHLRASHFVCDTPPCDGGASSAFGTALEYRTHLATDHGIRDTAALARALGFQVRRANRDGTGAALDSDGASEGVVVVPPPPLPLLPAPQTQQRADSAAAAADANGGSAGAAGWAGAARPSGGRSGGAAGGTDVFPSLPRPSQPVAPPRSELSLVGRAWNERARASQEPTAAAAAPPRSWAAASAAGAAEDDEEAARARRNARLAAALNIGGAAAAAGGGGEDAARARLHEVQWSAALVAWARERPAEVARIERQIAELLADPRGTSAALKPMPRERRRCAHELAEACGLGTISYDAEPKRYVCVQRRAGARLPSPLLSQAARDPRYRAAAAGATSGAAPAAAAAAAPPPPRGPLRMPPPPLHPDTCLEIFSMQQRLTAEDVAAALADLLSADAVLSVHAPSLTAAPGTQAVAELVSAAAAAAALQALERSAEDAAVAAAITRSVFARPFRARPHSGRSGSSTAASAAAPAAAAPAAAARSPGLSSPVITAAVRAAVRDSWEDDDGEGGASSTADAAPETAAQVTAAAPAVVRDPRFPNSVLAGRLLKPEARTWEEQRREQEREKERLKAARRAARERARAERDNAGQLEAHSTAFQGLVSDSDSDADSSINSDASSSGGGGVEPGASPAAAAPPSSMEDWELAYALAASAELSGGGGGGGGSAGSPTAAAAAAAAAASSTDAWDDESEEVVARRVRDTAARAAGAWACEACTLENAPAAHSCAACGASRGEWTVVAS